MEKQAQVPGQARLAAGQRPIRVVLTKVGLDGHDRGVKVIAVAPTFSSRYLMRLVPGIGMMWVALCNNQARANWAGEQPASRANAW